jgi:hypothetical protein
MKKKLYIKPECVCSIIGMATLLAGSVNGTLENHTGEYIEDVDVDDDTNDSSLIP